MKLVFFLLLIFLIQSCSFDNKSGIWTSDKLTQRKIDDIFKDFKKIETSKNFFKETVTVKKDFKFLLSPQVETNNWEDAYYSKNNVYENFFYNNLNKVAFKSKKISRNELSNSILFSENNFFSQTLKKYNPLFLKR